MADEDLFIDGYTLPKPLSKEETFELFKSSKFDEESRNKIIEHNIRLVLHEVLTRFHNYEYDKNDLVSVGTIGLVNAVDTFDSSKGYEFATYATRCIDNEILKFINKTNTNEVSFEEVIIEDDDYEDNIKLESILSDKTDFRDEIDKKELFTYIRSLISKLNGRDRKIVMLYFGFDSDRCYNTTEIAKIIKISKTYVCRILNRTIEKLGAILNNKGLIELYDNQEKSEIKMTETRTIYAFFNNYTEDEVNYMISKLTYDENRLLILKYGNDLHHPHNFNLSRNDSKKFYKYLVPRMKEILINSFGTRIKCEESKVKKDKTCKKDRNKRSCEQLDSRQSKQLQEKSNDELNIQLDEITNKDCLKLSDLLKIPSIFNMINVLNIKEAIIISLKLGYVNGKYFSNEQIANSLEISEEEVKETIKKIVLLYKQNINQQLDSLIDESTMQSGNTRVLNINNKEV